VGAEVEERALFEAPGCGEDSAQEPTGEEVPTPPERIDRPARLEEPPHRSDVPPCEDHLGRDADVAYHGSEVPGRSEVEGDGLLEEERLAGLCTQRGHLRLDVRWDSEGQGVAVVQQLLEVPEAAGVVGAGDLLGRLRAPGPHTGELGVRARRQHRGVEHAGPRSGSDQTDPYRRGRRSRGGVPDHQMVLTPAWRRSAARGWIIVALLTSFASAGPVLSATGRPDPTPSVPARSSSSRAR
jgi:hypothetical protein